MGSAYYNCAKCGSSNRVSRGNNASSARYAKWLESQGRLCDACSSAKFAAEHAAKIAAAAADPMTTTLPALTGSDKQIAWAQALRLETLPRISAAVDTLLEQIDGMPDLSAPEKLEADDAVHLIAQELRERTDARAWIDNRDTRAWDRIIRESLIDRLATLAPAAHADMIAARGGPLA
jgi:hypothetical protein